MSSITSVARFRQRAIQYSEKHGVIAAHDGLCLFSKDHPKADVAKINTIALWHEDNSNSTINSFMKIVTK